MENKNHLKNFANFLLEKNRLNEAVILNINAARKHSSIIEKSGIDSEAEILELFTKSFENFLKAIADNKGFDNIFESYHQWQINNYNLPSSTIQLSDILIAFEIRKEVLTKLIPTYTSDNNQILPIKEELDALFFIAKKTGMSYASKRKVKSL